MTSTDRKAVLIVCAMEEELDAFFKCGKEHDKILKTQINGFDVYGIIGGIGKTAMAFMLGQFLSIHVISAIINVGVCASLSKEVPPFDIFVGEKCAYHDVDVTAFGYEIGQMAQSPLYYECDEKLRELAMSFNDSHLHEGTIVSGDSFVTEKNKKFFRFDEFPEAIAVDMESASVGQCSYIMKIPFLIIRAISDAPGFESDNTEGYNERLNEASKKAAELAYKVICAL